MKTMKGDDPSQVLAKEGLSVVEQEHLEDAPADSWGRMLLVNEQKKRTSNTLERKSVFHLK